MIIHGVDVVICMWCIQYDVALCWCVQYGDVLYVCLWCGVLCGRFVLLMCSVQNNILCVHCDGTLC